MMVEGIENITSYLDEDHRHAYNSSPINTGFGLTAMTYYLEGGGRKHLLQAYNTGLLIGANMKIVDDLLDGDDCDAVDDREAFLDNYIDSIETGSIPAPLEQEAEKAAYTAGTVINHSFSENCVESLAHTARDMRDLLIDEDKSREEGYRKYISVAGGMVGEFLALGLDDIEDYSANTSNVELGYDIGVAGEITDDLYDDDVPLEDAKLEQLQQESLERLGKHDSVAASIAIQMAGFYPIFADSINIAASTKQAAKSKLNM